MSHIRNVLCTLIVYIFPNLQFNMLYISAGGGLFGIFGKYTNRFGKDPIVLLGLLVHFATFLLIFYNLPVKAVFDNVPANQSHGYLFDPSKYVIWERPRVDHLLSEGHTCISSIIVFVGKCLTPYVYMLIASEYLTQNIAI